MSRVREKSLHSFRATVRLQPQILVSVLRRDIQGNGRTAKSKGMDGHRNQNRIQERANLMQQPMRSAKGSANWEDTSSAVYEVMKEKSTTEKTEWPTIEEQQAYWRTKEADLSLDKVEATTDYYDHFLAGNTDSEIPFQSNETDLSGSEKANRVSPPKGKDLPEQSGTGAKVPSATVVLESPSDIGRLPVVDRCPLNNSSLSIEDRKGQSDATLADK